ncbi:ABC transporter substrate-binding protein [Lederbergia citrea]|uniref:ABC transporter substrate-binding protein n=1 Tax=Lederbergia citrea TaxID=2833581 RepID=UPI001BC96AAC|nr:sugar ABC transporter substrate-binding protein [Lederbergia citrea]MBS4178470.1 sugar ABC transporter substrate-binding protein [Lederbergia citrea]
MKKKWSFLKVTALLLTLLLLISGCNSSGGEKTSGSKGGSNSSGSSDGKKVELTMASWGNPAEIKVLQRGIDAYEKDNPNVKIKLIPVPGDNYEQKLMTELSGGKAHDVFYVGAETIAKLIETGKIADLTEFLDSSASHVKADDFADGLWGAARKDGKIYGVSVDNNPLLMYYNKTVLKEAGVEKTPQEYYDEGNWNWDTFAEITGKIHATGKRGFVADKWSAHLFSWVWSNGGQLYDDEGNYILAENEKAKEAFEYIDKMIKGGNFTFAGSLPKGQGADAMFMSNQVGFVAAGRWLTPMFSENKSLEFDYIPWPTNTGNKMEPAAIAIAFMSVAKESKNLEEAMKFMSFYVSAEGQKARLADNGNAVPSVSGVDELITGDAIPEHASYLIDAREIGIVDDKQVLVPGLDKELADIMDLMLLGKQDADKTIDAMSKKAKEMIEDYKNK